MSKVGPLPEAWTGGHPLHTPQLPRGFCRAQAASSPAPAAGSRRAMPLAALPLPQLSLRLAPTQPPGSPGCHVGTFGSGAPLAARGRERRGVRSARASAPRSPRRFRPFPGPLRLRLTLSWGYSDEVPDPRPPSSPDAWLGGEHTRTSSAPPGPAPARPPPPPPAPSFRPLSAGRGRGGSPRSRGWLSAGPGPFSPLGPKAPARRRGPAARGWLSATGAGLPGLILLGLRFRPPELLGVSTNRVTRTPASQRRSYCARLFSSRPPALPEKCGK